MDEMKLSSDLNVITAEINSYKQVAGKAIFEIGKRLKHVKENDLAHGEWTEWCENQIGISRDYANRYVRVYEEIGNDDTYRDLGVQALYLIATLPQEEREKDHTLPSGETKAVDEMTVRELQEVKKQLKFSKDRERLAEIRLEQTKKSEQIALSKLEEIESKKPEVKEIIKEVVPDDYERTKQELKRLEKQISTMKTSDHDLGLKEKEVKLLTLDASKSVLKTKITIDEFLQEVAFTSYRRGAIASSSEGTKNKLREGVDDLKNFINEMEMALDGTIEHQ